MRATTRNLFALALLGSAALAVADPVKTLMAEVAEHNEGWTLTTDESGVDKKVPDLKGDRKYRFRYDGKAWSIEYDVKASNSRGEDVPTTNREVWDGKHWASFSVRPGLEHKGGTGTLFEAPVPRFVPMAFIDQIAGRPIAELVEKGELRPVASGFEGEVKGRRAVVETDPMKEGFVTRIALEEKSGGGITRESFTALNPENVEGSWVPTEGRYEYSVTAPDGVRVREIVAELKLSGIRANAPLAAIPTKIPEGYRLTGKNDEIFAPNAKGAPEHAGWVKGEVKPVAWFATGSFAIVLLGAIRIFRPSAIGRKIK
ncbi:hypothetical protein EON79_08875 [bacterium]|nr:MAG: hypothetical protein EON79_08875 [bacterium]